MKYIPAIENYISQFQISMDDIFFMQFVDYTHNVVKNTQGFAFTQFFLSNYVMLQIDEILCSIGEIVWR